MISSSPRALACVILLGLLGLAGCATSPDNSYYMLMPTPEAAATLDSGHDAAPLPLSVSMPAYLDRSQIVFVSADGKADIREFERWAEPLDGMVRRVLAQDLRSQARRDVNPQQKIILGIDSFVFGNGQAVLKAHWTIVPKSGAEPPAGQVHVFADALPASADTLVMVNAMSQLLDSLARQMAASLR